jgi:cytochrome c peroxidase
MRSNKYLVVALSVLLTACGGSSEPDTVSTPAPVVETPVPPTQGGTAQGPSANTVPTPVTPTPASPKEVASSALKDSLIDASAGVGLSAFTMPASDDYDNIPQDPNNPITAQKVALGKALFHETALSTNGVNDSKRGTWSCASCHHANAGFKSGVKQGIGEGGWGFANSGANRVLADGFTMDSSDPDYIPDVQPVTSPTILNTAYQDVMLWNGQFGNATNGIVNAGITPGILSTEGTPKAENARQLSGLEIQAAAGQTVHRLMIEGDSVLQTNATYIEMFEAAFPNSALDVKEDSSKAIAAYERTVLANQSPFQLWLKGDEDAMSEQELNGANLFFGKANCSGCHTGPALSSDVGATEDEIFFAIGFADFQNGDPAVTGTVDDATSKGRGGFTGEEADNYKFKIATLYNLADTSVFGHGGSFSSVKEVVEYKNAGVSQKDIPASNIDYRFVPLGLSNDEVDDLVAFLENALYDPDLKRYVPSTLPSGKCITVADNQSMLDTACTQAP